MALKGETLPILPVAGGFHVEKMRQYREPGPTSARRVVALKGYQHWAGRALAGLHRLRCAPMSSGPAASLSMYIRRRQRANSGRADGAATNLPVEIVPESSHEDMLRLQGRARVAVGLSISDGLSTSALESLVMGAFPVQSDTSCLGEELVQDGETAFLVPPEDPRRIAEAIRRAVTDDELVDRAAAANDLVVKKRLDYSVIQPEVVAMYERIVAQGTERPERTV